MDVQNSVISVVIPAYNAQGTLRTCLDSVFKQSYQVFEIIVVNDGSIDKTADILQEYMNLSDRIKVIEIKNQGVNHARKLAVENSRGSYITFLDADDQFRDDALEMYLENIKDHDVVLANCYKDDVLTSKEYLSLMMDELLPKELWGKLFRRELLTSEVMELPREIGMGEDYIWNIRVSKYIHSVKLIRDNYYVYDNQNLNSAIHKFKWTIDYEHKFIKIVTESLVQLGKSEDEICTLLTIPYFNAFVNYAHSNCTDQNFKEFVSQIASPSNALRDKRNMVLYSIMQLQSIVLKAFLIRLYFRIK